MPASIVIHTIAPAEARPIRHKVLRAGLPFNTTIWPEDDSPESIHLGAFWDGHLMGIVSLFHTAPPDGAPGPACQLRGMAVLEKARGQGLGKRLAEECIHRARAAGAATLWCNARANAKEFYARFGFQVIGEPFDLPDIGPHYRMLRDLTQRS